MLILPDRCWENYRSKLKDHSWFHRHIVLYFFSLQTHFHPLFYWWIFNNCAYRLSYTNINIAKSNVLLSAYVQAYLDTNLIYMYISTFLLPCCIEYRVVIAGAIEGPVGWEWMWRVTKAPFANFPMSKILDVTKVSDRFSNLLESTQLSCGDTCQI